jgi:ubiquitin carboxyl-terminal hydrolase 2/21
MSSDDKPAVEETKTETIQSDVENRGCVGLANLGNTCFMNSAIQALRHCPEWTVFCSQGKVEEHCLNKDSVPSRMLYAYIDLMKSLWSGTGPAYVNPRGFYHILSQSVQGTVYEDFTKRSPQDAHEFLMWLLDQMYMGTQQSVTIQISDKETIPSGIHAALTGWKTAFEKQYSPLTDLVFGMYRIQYECSNCKTNHTRWETFNCIKIMPGLKEDGSPMNINECLQKELADEDIEGYACDTCKVSTFKATKRTTIWRLPKLMIVTVKRFTPMGTRLNFPIEFDVSTSATFTDHFSQDSMEPSKTGEYTTFATVDHHGNHMGGHYTAQCKSPITKKWHFYNDDSVNEIKEPRFGSSTYLILMRQRRSGDE